MFSKSLAVLLLLGCVVVSWGGQVVGEGQHFMAKQRPGLYKEFEVRAGLGTSDIGNYVRGYLHYVDNYNGVNKPQWTAQDASVGCFNSYRVSSHGVSLPPLRIGDMVPFFGDLYQVTDLLKLSPLKSNEGKDVMRMKRLEKSPVEGIVVHADSCAVPLMGRVSFIFHTVDFNLAVKSIDKDSDNKLSALINVYKAKVYAQDPARVRVGDVLAVQEHAYKVLSIVPRDAEKGVIGWLEIDPEPLSEAELKKAKSIVRPVPSQPDAKK